MPNMLLHYYNAHMHALYNLTCATVDISLSANHLGAPLLRFLCSWMTPREVCAVSRYDYGTSCSMSLVLLGVWWCSVVATTTGRCLNLFPFGANLSLFTVCLANFNRPKFLVRASLTLSQRACVATKSPRFAYLSVLFPSFSGSLPSDLCGIPSNRSGDFAKKALIEIW